MEPKSHYFLVFLFCLSTLSCSLPGRMIHLFNTPTPTITPTITVTATITLTPSPTLTLTSTSTLTPTLTPTFTPTPSFTPTPTPLQPTDTPTITTVPATLTPGPNQITSGQDVWQLTSLEMRHTVNVLGHDLQPQTRGRYPEVYEFLVFNFDCVTGTSLLTLYTGSDMGLTIVLKPYGYRDLFVLDSQGVKYSVALLGACWLAVPVPSTTTGFTLYFKDLPPFTPSLPLR